MKKLFSSSPLLQDGGLALVRIVTGYFMAWHGWEVFDAEAMKVYFDWDSIKGFSSPVFMAYLGKATELVAGVLLILGLFTRLACLLMIVVMCYVAFFIGEGKIMEGAQHAFMFVLMGFVFFFAGGGKYSLDNLFFKRNK